MGGREELSSLKVRKALRSGLTSEQVGEAGRGRPRGRRPRWSADGADGRVLAAVSVG
jgi:hypothetical protein